MATQWTAGLIGGSVLPATTLNTIGAAWESYTPTLTQSVTVTKTVNVAKYCQIQKMITCDISLTATSAGTAANEVAVGLPIATTATTNRVIGTGFIYDASSGIVYNVTAYNATTTTAKFFYQAAFGWGFSPNIALANGDQIRMLFTYEAA